MTLEPNATFMRFWQNQGTAVAGTWAWFADALQTDYASVTEEGEGSYSNTTSANLDEYKWSNIFLTKGTYKINITWLSWNDQGIAEVLFGTTSLGTQDMYAAVTVYNQVWTITFTLATDQTADMRFRVNGKNDASSDYYVLFSIFELAKTG